MMIYSSDADVDVRWSLGWHEAGWAGWLAPASLTLFDTGLI